ncbi:MAG: cytochrome ubiquinol oxidase subunit I [Actinobacteria bacterium]|nr:cytochrome ubiquinol oxidase subunit I [Actinomycetota bacterium]
MNTLDLARWQFGITTVYHFFMVPLTIGLSLVVAWYQTRWYRSGDERYLRLTRFFGKLFVVNFAMGVVTGIVQEFQFGMAWSNYSRFVGDVFGAPLAMEALVAFFLESTFIGLWIFGWDRLPKKVHLATIWAAAIGTNLSAFFIIAANSWMQHPVGAIYNSETGRAEMTDIWAVLTNNTALAAYPHVIAGALLVAAVFVGGVSAWSLLTRKDRMPEGDVTGFRIALRGMIWLTLFATVAISISGDYQARLMFEQQPMKMASAEALCDAEVGPGLSVFAINLSNVPGCDLHSWSIPQGLSLLASHKFDQTILGVNDLSQQYNEQFGPGDYRPSVFVTYWGFRLMIFFGFAGTAGAIVALWLTRGGRVPTGRWLAPVTLVVMTTPFLGNIAGWVFTEMGRQPWVVAPNPTGIPEVRLLTADAVSKVSAGTILTSLIGFTLLYGVLGLVELRLLSRYVKAGPDAAMPNPEAPPADPDADPETDGTPLSFAY